MASGWVKWFDVNKGYGFITPEDGGKDVFVHIKAVHKAGYTDLLRGARVSYDLIEDQQGKTSAENLRIG